MVKSIMLVALLLISQVLEAKTFTFKNKERTIELIGVVNATAIDLAAQIDMLSNKSSAPIYMLINSPGGAVLPGMILVDSIRQAQLRGVKFKCFSGVLAASMAFIILGHCDERYSFSETKLLFHPMSLGVEGARIQELYTDLKQTVILEQRIMATLRSQLDMGEEIFLENYWAETFWSGAELKQAAPKFLKIVDRVRGAGESLFKYRQQSFLFGEVEYSGPVQKILERFESLGQ